MIFPLNAHNRNARRVCTLVPFIIHVTGFSFFLIIIRWVNFFLISTCVSHFPAKCSGIINKVMYMTSAQNKVFIMLGHSADQMKFCSDNFKFCLDKFKS